MKRNKGNKPKKSIPSKEKIENSGSSNLSQSQLVFCPHCQKKMRTSAYFQGLAYCGNCGLFFLRPASIRPNLRLDTTFKALIEVAGKSFIFDETCAAVISNLSPDLKNEYLDIIRRISYQLNDILKDWLRGKLDESDQFVRNQIVQEIKTLISKIPFNPERELILVFTSIRKALNLDSQLLDSWTYQSSASESNWSPYDNSALQTIAGKMNISSPEAFYGEEINVEWFYPYYENDSFFIEYGGIHENKKIKEVKVNKGKFKITMPDDDFTIRIYGESKYRVYEELETTIKLALKPNVTFFDRYPSSPVYESYLVDFKWGVENATQVDLIVYYSDHNYITRDVSSLSSIKLSFYENAKLVLKAKRGKIENSKTCYVEVIPVPKFNVSKIPSLTLIDEIPKIKLTDYGRIEELQNLISDITQVTNDASQKISSFNIKDIKTLFKKFPRIKI